MCRRMQYAVWCLGCVLLAATGCSPGAYTGGGWIRSAQLDDSDESVSDGIATFGLNGQARDRDGDGEIDDIRGQIQYNDHGNGIAIHGEIEDGGYPGFVFSEICSGGECVGPEFDEDGNEIFSEQVFVANGTYKPVPKSAGDGGTYEFALVDWGQEGPNEGDYINLTLSGGVYDGYTNEGFLKGGNFSAHER